MGGEERRDAEEGALGTTDQWGCLLSGRWGHRAKTLGVTDSGAVPWKPLPQTPYEEVLRSLVLPGTWCRRQGIV